MNALLRSVVPVAALVSLAACARTSPTENNPPATSASGPVARTTMTSSSPAAASASAPSTLFPASALQEVIRLPNALTNGVTVSPEGRRFLTLARQPGQEAVPQVAEHVDGALRPYPDATWNAWKQGRGDAARGWVRANSIRFGPDGLLWVVDFGTNDPQNEKVETHGAKLVGIDTATNAVVKTFTFDKVIDPLSAVDDVRFHGRFAFVSDAGRPGLIVLDMTSGQMWRALDKATPSTAQKPLRAEGHEVRNPQDKPIYFHADQLEVSPDGETLYYMPACGPLSAIETRHLEDARMPDAERIKHVRLFANNPTAGGTAIDAAGNVYASDVDRNAVLRITPSGQISTLVQDPRLVWVDAMWITPDGKLWMPASQMSRTVAFNGGKNAVVYPVVVYTLDIGQKPSPADHR